MIFRTELTVAPVAVPLPSTARVLTIGSCFAAVLAQKLAAAKLPVLENPFGTVLNPISACRLLAVAAGADEFDLTERTIQRDGRWYSYDAPSGVSGATFEELQAAIDERLTRVRDFVRTADALVLTMGTAWAWRLDGEVVANCHKQPGGLFQKTLLSVQEIVAAFAEMHSWLLRLNPKLRVVLTVSPVRHPKETLPGSSVSKSTLRLACHHLDALVRDVTYFPAYELLLDDLRDYRFFAADMLHPSAMAEDYIFHKFAGAYFDARFAAHREAWEEIKRAMAHRSANPQGEAHQQFLLNTLAKLDALDEVGIEVRGETAELEAQLVRPRRPKLPALPPKLEVKADGLPQSKPVSEGRVESSAVSPKAPMPVSGASDAPRPIKPIIKIELPPLTPRPERNGQRNQPLVRPVVRVEMPAEAPQTAPPQLPTEVPAAAEATAGNTPAASAVQQQPSAPDSPNKKRRGRRGGRRHKQRREEGQSEASLPLDTLPELETELVAISEAAAETAVTQELPTAALASSLLAPALPAEEVAAENALAQPLETSEADSANRPIAAPRRPNRQTRGRGGKKVTLQKVKPESKPATASPAAEAVSLPAATDPIAVPAKPEKARPAREDRQRKPRPAPVAAPPVTASVAETVAPTAPVAAPITTPSAKPSKQQSMNARTPGRSNSKGPVATPVERAAAARATKKAGVGALLAALGGVAAPSIPVPAAVAALTPAAVAVMPPSAAVMPEPVAVAPKAKLPVRAAATKPKPVAKAPTKPAAKSPEKLVEPPPAPPAAKALTKAAAKTPKPVARAAKPAAAPVPPAAPEPTPELVPKAAAKRPTKPRTPKNK